MKEAPFCQETQETNTHHTIVFKLTISPLSLYVFKLGYRVQQKKTKTQDLQQRWLSVGFKVSAKSVFLLLDVLSKYFIWLISNWPLFLTFSYAKQHSKLFAVDPPSHCLWSFFDFSDQRHADAH